MQPICQGRRKNDRDRMRVRTGCQFVRGKRKMVGIELGTYRSRKLLHRNFHNSTSVGHCRESLCQVDCPCRGWLMLVLLSCEWGVTVVALTLVVYWLTSEWLVRSDCGDSPSHDSLPVDCAACPSQLCQAVNCRLKSSGNSRSTSNWDRLEIGWCIHICAYTHTDLVYQSRPFGILSRQV